MREVEEGMAGSSHYNAVCTITVYIGDKANATEHAVRIGPGSAYPFITGVTIERKQGLINQITLSVDAPFEEGRALLNGPLFYTGNIIEVTIRYPDDDKAILKATAVVIKGGIGITLTPNGISGTISAEQAPVMARRTKPTPAAEAEPTFTWLEGLVLECGYTALEASEKTVGVINRISRPAPEVAPLLDQFENFCTDNNLSWWADAEIGAITVLDEEDVDKGLVTRVFVMRNSFIDTGYLSKYGFLDGKLGSNPRAYPIISYSPEINAGFFVNREAIKTIRTGIKADGTREVESHDETTAGVKKTSKSEDGAAGSEDIAADGIKTVKQFEENEAAEVVSLYYPEHDDRSPEDKRHIRAVQNRARAYGANLNTFGIPDIEPNEIIAVVGLGDLLDGLFVVNQITQTWSAGALETSIAIYSRNAGEGT